MSLNFTINRRESEIIRQIGQRANATFDADFLSTVLDISTVHANGCPLRLDDLLQADGFNFAHDIFGINRHLDRDTGKLQDAFVPRFARPSALRREYGSA